MKDLKKVINSAIAGAIAMGMVGITTTTYAADQKADEKCYGIAKKGKNDCGTAGNSCAGKSIQDNQKDAFITMPKGLCDKIAGGSLSAPAVNDAKKS